MKVRYSNFNSSLTFEIESDGPKGIFRELAAIQEVFDSEKCCGVCGSEDIRYQFRQVEDFDFFELVCRVAACRARLSFGQHKKGGGLFVKRKDEDGRFLDHGGWSKYVKPGEDSGPAPSTNGRAHGSPTQESDMQDVYDRLGSRFGVHAPVSFQAALALLKKFMDDNGSGKEYETVQTKLKARYPRGVTEASVKKAVLAELYNAYTVARSAIDEVPF